MRAPLAAPGKHIVDVAKPQMMHGKTQPLQRKPQHRLRALIGGRHRSAPYQRLRQRHRVSCQFHPHRKVA
jgi:hypothetical protein